MNYYVISCEDAPDSFEKRRSIRQAHLAHLAALQRENRLLLAGPVYDQETPEPYPFGVSGSLIIGEFSDIEAAKAWAAADPFATAGVFARITVRLFRKILP